MKFLKLKQIKINDPISSDYGDLELALYGSFLPIPSLDLFKNKNEDTNEIKMVTNEETVESKEGSSIYPGKIIPFKVNTSNNDTSNLDEGEIAEIQPISNENQSLTSEFLDNFIHLNKDKGDSVLLSVTNLSNQTIKVKYFYF